LAVLMYIQTNQNHAILIINSNNISCTYIIYTGRTFN